MENIENRVLAYKMAKVLDHDALTEISGGNINTHQTFFLSGTDLKSIDYQFDY